MRLSCTASTLHPTHLVEFFKTISEPRLPDVILKERTTLSQAVVVLNSSVEELCDTCVVGNHESGHLGANGASVCQTKADHVVEHNLLPVQWFFYSQINILRAKPCVGTACKASAETGPPEY